MGIGYNGIENKLVIFYKWVLNEIINSKW
jgi:hypothetical protein